MPAYSRELLVRRFSDLIRSTPHRDITHVPYSQLFVLYVQMMKHVCTEIREDGNTCNKTHKEEGLTLTQMKRNVDSMLLSSLMAPRWSEVLLEKDEHEMEMESTNNSKGSKYGNASLWYDKNNLTSFYDYHSTNITKQVKPINTFQEMYTCQFLVEPLHGGRCIDLWLNSLRSSTSSSSSSDTVNNDSNVHHCKDSANERNKNENDTKFRKSQTLHCIIPFTTLWEIKREAFLRSSSVATQASLSPHIGGSASTRNVLSLQERTLRQTLLRSLHYILELQRVSNSVQTERNSFPHNRNADNMCHSTPLIQLHVMTPTDEFDALCQLSRIRSLFNLTERTECTKTHHNSDNKIKCLLSQEELLESEWTSKREECKKYMDKKESNNNITNSMALFKMSSLCNSPLYRLAYLCMYCNYLSMQTSRLHTATNASVTADIHVGLHNANNGKNATSISNEENQQTYEFDSNFVTTVLCDRSEEARRLRSMSSLLSRWCKVRERSQLDEFARYNNANNNTKRKSNSSSAIHHEAQQECTEMIRKLSNREECLRQMFSCREGEKGKQELTL